MKKEAMHRKQPFSMAQYLPECRVVNRVISKLGKYRARNNAKYVTAN